MSLIKDVVEFNLLMCVGVGSGVSIYQERRCRVLRDTVMQLHNRMSLVQKPAANDAKKK